jgi:hypothetical protein
MHGRRTPVALWLISAVLVAFCSGEATAAWPAHRGEAGSGTGVAGGQAPGLRGALKGLGRAVLDLALAPCRAISEKMERFATVLSDSPPAASPGLPAARSFHLAMTPFAYDVTAASQAATYDTLAAHCDMIAHHFDWGVPWPEAYANGAYAPAVLADIDYRVSHTPAGQKVYLALTSLSGARDAPAAYWGSTHDLPRPGAWAGRDFDSSEVRTAYLNYCRYMIGRFHPQYLAYGIESNMLALRNPAVFPKYVEMCRQVYNTLKAENPNLPVFLTIQADIFAGDPVNQGPAIQQLLQYSDYVAVSSYPFLWYEDPADLPADWFAQVAALAPEKPFVVSETGFIAETLILADPPTNVPGSETRQDNYVSFLLTKAAALDARFVVWFVPQDYDKAWDAWQAYDPPPPEFAKVWKDTGLLDGDGNPRASLATWDSWRALPITPALGTRLTGLSASCAKGHGPMTQAFDVWNAGGGTLNYTVSVSAAWLSCSPASGSSTGASQSVTVTYHPSGLAVGSHSATITVASAGATGDPQSIPVTLTVTQPPGGGGGGGGGGGCALARSSAAAGDAWGWSLPYLLLAAIYFTLRYRARTPAHGLPVSPWNGDRDR